MFRLSRSLARRQSFEVRFDGAFSMKTVFTDNMELRFIEVWHSILTSTEGTMTSQAEKIDKALVLLKEYAPTIGHALFNHKQVKNKIDSLKKKAKAAYKDVRVKTTTGANVEDDYDLEVGLLIIRSSPLPQLTTAAFIFHTTCLAICSFRLNLCCRQHTRRGQTLGFTTTCFLIFCPNMPRGY